MTETKSTKAKTTTKAKISEIKPEQLARLREITDSWIRLATRGKCANISPAELQETINWNYKQAGLKAPTLVIANNLVEYKMMGHIATQAGYKTIDEKTIYEKYVGLVDNMEKQLYDKLTNEVGSKLWTESKERMETALLTNMLNPLQRAVTAMNESELPRMKGIFADVKKSFEEQTGVKLGKKNIEYGLATIEYYFGLAHDSHLPFYEFCLEEGFMENKTMVEYIEKFKNGFLTMLFFDGLAIACRLPKQVKKNGAGFLHDDKEFAVKWNDGTGHNFLRGVYFDENMFNRVINSEIPAKELLQIKNMEQRYASIQVYNIDKLLKEVNAKRIDKANKKNHEGKPYFIELYAIDGLIPNRTLKLVKYSDPSTGRVYPDFVPDKIMGAEEAMAFKFNVPLPEYKTLTKEA